MKYGLSDSVINKIKRVLRKYPQAEKAVIYGSRAKGNFNNGSDIDLTLHGDTLELQDVLQILDDLDELYLPYNIDLSIYDNIEDSDVIAHIDRVGKTFYRRKKEAAV